MIQEEQTIAHEIETVQSKRQEHLAFLMNNHETLDSTDIDFQIKLNLSCLNEVQRHLSQVQEHMAPIQQMSTDQYRQSQSLRNS
jgi:hypothetical protein